FDHQTRQPDRPVPAGADDYSRAAQGCSAAGLVHGSQTPPGIEDRAGGRHATAGTHDLANTAAPATVPPRRSTTPDANADRRGDRRLRALGAGPASPVPAPKPSPPSLFSVPGRRKP